MDLISLIKVAGEALLRNKSRSFLTVLGIVIGVTSVITLVSIGGGLRRYIGGQFEGLGTNIVVVIPANMVNEQGQPQVFSGPPQFSGKLFSERDLRDIQRLVSGIQMIVPQVFKKLRVQSASGQKTIDVVGSTVKFFEVRDITMDEGRSYNDSDVRLSRRVAVLGPTTAKNLFPGVNPVGNVIRISSISYQVIGVTNPRGASGGLADLDDNVYVPITSLQKLVDTNGIDFVLVKAKNSDYIPQVVSEIKSLLGKRRQEDSFSVLDQRQLLRTAESVLRVLTLGLSGIAAISLLVGGIGVMNMMLVTVTERTREIGLRKALGATPRVILGQFLAEAVLLSLTGGVIGILIGAGGSLIINQFFPARVSGTAVMLAFGVSAGVGIIFGILPARRAAKMSPVEALMYE